MHTIANILKLKLNLDLALTLLYLKIVTLNVTIPLAFFYLSVCSEIVGWFGFSRLVGWICIKGIWKMFQT